MIPLRVSQVATVLGAELWPGSGLPADLGVTITDVTTDSRSVGPGSLFVALAGERVDGHTFVAQVLAAGAVAVLVAHPVDGVPGTQLVVADPLEALGRLARHVVDRLRPGGLRVVGITGSQGKTSTKDLLGAVLAAAGPTVAPAGNLNNELGVPLTVLRVVGSTSASEGNPSGGVGGRPPSGQGTEHLVVEMGARGIGHIAYLCGIAPPDVAVVLNVGHAHVGEFGGREAIAQAKGELVEAVGEDGVAVLNADDPRVWAMRSRTRARVLPFAVDRAPDGPDAVWAEGLVGDERGRYVFTLHVRRAGVEAQAPVALRGTGRHQVANAVAAAAAAVALGLDVDPVAGALSAAEPASRWRMEVHDRADGVRVVNDSYNANPASMAAAVETLAELGRGRGRTWAVVGDMLELGAEAPALHAELAVRLREAGIDEIVALGEFAPLLVADAPGRARVAESVSQAAAWVRAGVAPGDVVLVKASRGLALNLVADEILRTPDPGSDA
ncbi:UDP-N-acetylmuramoyl-tripeptide--D-alanyl-D-alanine ligase [Microlunatus antarcticus]|uniref:UDP-N-acetylmuramoyl-tripeptide--D-alanyl-D-alanine ligase n=1 Tax=Microlunatus antarcticus TaxID=53388 RepID=A0A7W5JXR1_9ACTN|nr:UDP-N-acetylmuramoyl-tripeptide--D-alanyl-D-alanine ligase [Microlunatus antarcticus]